MKDPFFRSNIISIIYQLIVAWNLYLGPKYIFSVKQIQTKKSHYIIVALDGKKKTNVDNDIKFLFHSNNWLEKAGRLFF